MQKPSVLRSIHYLLGRCVSCHQKRFYTKCGMIHPYHISTVSVLKSPYCLNRSIYRNFLFCKYSTATKAEKQANLSSSEVKEKLDESSTSVNELSKSASGSTVTNPARELKLEEERRATEILEHLSPEKAKKLKVLRLEYDIWLSSGHRTPRNMTNAMWLELLESESVTSRNKLYKFWCIKEAAQRKHEYKKQKRKEHHLARLQERAKSNDDEDNTYPNKILKKIKDDDYHKHNFAFSMIHGPHLVIDMSYDDMRDREARNLVSQFLKCHGYNKTRSEPFHFHFCNVKKDSLVAEALYRYFINLDQILYTVSEESYLDCYPQKNLVYLSPYAKHPMTEFSYDDIYILGGMVDKVSELPMSIAKAKKDRVRCVKLPLDQYLQWTKGSKALTLDQMVMILHTLKETNDWGQALNHVPKRKFLWLHEKKQS
ncbi:hypothetical protein LSH36_85g06000 [Paralvinella palmiformis]|uniref:RNA (guanine-9-)-methyltransferase domain-containing protein 1 n=1 Tax=Paralvinella palmiformis TaxID=53620 RepID=A0AAD9K1P1_9ANNE|nr:hypothetical protein LSH36_85g06000 [Paralvinella palmiformis]